MRTLLLFLLCLTILFQGVAPAHAFKPACPMEHAGQAMAMDGGTSDMDCCNDAATTTKTGQHCKAGKGCTTGGLGILFQPTLTVSSRIVALDIPFSPPFIHLFDPSRVWRPPALS